MNVLSLGGALIGRGAVSMGLLIGATAALVVPAPGCVTLAIGDAAVVAFQPTMPATITLDSDTAAVVSVSAVPIASVSFEVTPVATVELDVDTVATVTLEFEEC